MTVVCPNCRLEMDNVPELAGQSVACPRCGNHFVMPGIPRATSMQHVVTPMNIASSSSRFREARGLSEMFEMDFNVYVTPLIVRAIWLFKLLFAVVLLFAAIIAVFLVPFESSVGTNLEIVKRCCGVLALMAFLFFELLSLRLGLEMAVVFFNVSLSLQSIDKKTKA